MSIPAIPATGFTPYVAPAVGPAAPAAPTAPTAPASGQDFGNLVLDGLDRLDGLTHQSDSLAVKAATGDLQSIHAYTIAATQTAVSTQLSVAVRNKAIDAFNEIMRMQV